MTSLLPSLWGHPKDQGSSDISVTSLHREIDRVFDDFNRRFGLSSGWNLHSEAGTRFMPQMDVVETEKSLEVTTELPGVAEADVEVTIVDDVLRIRGEKKAEQREEKNDYRMVERSYGSFERSLRLPFQAAPDQINAQFKDGILKVVLPKPPEAEAKTHKIAIKSDKA